MRKIFTQLMLMALLVVIYSTGAKAGLSMGDVKVEPELQLSQGSFRQCCPRPLWWNTVKAPVINSIDDLSRVWLDKKLAKRIKAKAFFRAMRDSRDDEIISRAIALYRFVDAKYPQQKELLEFGVTRYLDYRRSLERYGGKRGDTSANLVRQLARIYLREKRPEAAASIISTLVMRRGGEINDHLLELLSAQMVKALVALDRESEALQVANYAISAYQGSWEKKLVKSRNEVRKSLGPISYLYEPVFKYVAVLAALMVLLSAGLWLWLSRRANRMAAAQPRFGRGPV